MLTAEQAFAVWRELRARRLTVTFEHESNDDQTAIICEGYGDFATEWRGTDPDPLRALSKANAAFEAATAGGEKEETGG